MRERVGDGEVRRGEEETKGGGMVGSYGWVVGDGKMMRLGYLFW